MATSNSPAAAPAAAPAFTEYERAALHIQMASFALLAQLAREQGFNPDKAREIENRLVIDLDAAAPNACKLLAGAGGT
jgi:hypothetical protein